VNAKTPTSELVGVSVAAAAPQRIDGFLAGSKIATGDYTRSDIT
jgi:hypothetical protein